MAIDQPERFSPGAANLPRPARRTDRPNPIPQHRIPWLGTRNSFGRRCFVISSNQYNRNTRFVWVPVSSVVNDELPTPIFD
jgi:hypothetical protein|tara:strand:+ start:220 stop:462 length:243 start_codon:yes stop_codon:yes gene_type:complete